MVKRKVFIIRHNGGRLGNQLLLYANILAMCKQLKLECVNYSFYNYRKYFQLPSTDRWMIIFDLFGSLNLYSTHAKHLIIYQAYKLFSYLYQLTHPGTVLTSSPSGLTNLPPSPPKTKHDLKVTQALQSTQTKTFYIDGWEFTNPIGIRKHHKYITSIIKPKKQILKNLDKFLNPYKKFYSVGVHIRQGDYKAFQGGKLYFTQGQVAEILKHYAKKSKKKSILFIICSDESINLSTFKPLNAVKGPGSMIEDLFVLSRCKEIIGSDSTFGRFASYYGNIPFTIFKKFPND